jgi:hypothetical protein
MQLSVVAVSYTQKVYSTSHLHTSKAKRQALQCNSTVRPVATTSKGVKIEERQMEETASVGVRSELVCGFCTKRLQTCPLLLLPVTFETAVLNTEFSTDMNRLHHKTGPFTKKCQRIAAVITLRFSG